MQRFLQVATYIIMGWIVGAIFSSHVAFDMSASNIGTVWFWGWLVLWPVFLFLKFIWWGIIIAVLVGAGVGVSKIGESKGWW